MKSDTWIDEMVKEIEKDKPAPEEKALTLSDSDMDKLAEKMIKKMSSADFDVEKEKEKITEEPVKPNAEGEISLDEKEK